jgi:hypothetical protein
MKSKNMTQTPKILHCIATKFWWLSNTWENFNALMCSRKKQLQYTWSSFTCVDFMVFQLYLYCQLQWFGAFGFSECLCLYLLKYSSEGAETWQNHRLDISEYTDDENQW